ncbi:hypothetical protein CAOG_02793 [Capsaspora owczarzaki ATCC 30864]|uniref:Purple acid phosphatase n=1 Tax=Capsaspora owczarzaki (strain ATCC 30864) TaxID=595528 RepID=A0A0D2U9F6_CAPO3|nr:hypothetical protein CAOG_02793 [Capsaspora owczarzaki ATCC 30864]KJE91696.1 hypothetical protein CAOG_002793 [Capsaspora owczarzaki ATCC 30864]|eukprot:XP_004349546.1 hypothetical protein CAOG_02793 [Capsaspora owczarzaki ATCC 30864]
MRGAALFALLVALLAAATTTRAHKFVHPLEGIELAAMRRATKAESPRSLAFAVTPNTLEAAEGTVTVIWAGLDDPQPDDWIALYTPLPSNLSAIVPVKFKMCTISPTHLSSGSGSLTFTLINMRDSNSFVFFRGGLTAPVAVAQTDPVEFESYDIPMHPHLAITDNPSEMSLMWTSRKAAMPIALLGTSTTSVTTTFNATTTSYSASDMCGEPATSYGYRPAGLIHTVIFTGLQPRTRYYYVFGDPSYGMSTIYSFVSAPARGDTSLVRWVVFGDMGRAERDGSNEYQVYEPPSINTTDRIIAELKRGDVDFVGHFGDISYARGYASDWDSFFAQVRPIASAVPYLIASGNHERDWNNSGALFPGYDSGGECGVPYNARFLMPGSKPTSKAGVRMDGGIVKDSPWYSANYGPIHLTVMSTEHDFSAGSTQLAWIEQDLASVDRSVTPWLLFAGHRPMYIDSTDVSPVTGDQPVATALRQFVEPLLFKYRADLTMFGHHHSYQRSCPSLNLTCITTPQPPNAATPWSYLGPVNVVIGMAGQSLSQNLIAAQPSWVVAVNDQVYGYARLQADKTSLAFQFIINNSDQIGDQFTLRHA